MSILKNVKEIVDLVQKIDDVELYRKIVELEGEIVELTRQNRIYEQEIDQLKARLEVSKRMEFRKPFYFQEGDHVPFCPHCWEHEKKAFHLTEGRKGVWQCQHCKNILYANVRTEVLPRSTTLGKK